jgi:hypothetical protein
MDFGKVSTRMKDSVMGSSVATLEACICGRISAFALLVVEELYLWKIGLL